MIPVKICCIQDVDEAVLAVRLGASALGFVSAMPSGFGPIPEPRIAEIIATVPRGIETFLLTSKTEAQAIVAQARACRPTTLQLCTPLAPETIAALRHELPETRLIQVIHVTGPESVSQAIAAAKHVDALLLDTGVLSGPVRQLGGTGRTHDWSISRAIVEAVKVPVWLAGGLKPENVEAAIRTVRPHAVDLCSGVRVDHVLDEARVRAFIKAVAAAG